MPPPLKGQRDGELFSVEKCHNFAIPDRAFLDMVPHWWSQEGFPYCCDKAASTSVVDPSNSTNKGFVSIVMDKEVKARFSHWMAWVPSCDQDRDLYLDFKREVNWTVVEM